MGVITNTSLRFLIHAMQQAPPDYTTLQRLSVIHLPHNTDRMEHEVYPDENKQEGLKKGGGGTQRSSNILMVEMNNIAKPQSLRSWTTVKQTVLIRHASGVHQGS